MDSSVCIELVCYFILPFLSRRQQSRRRTAKTNCLVTRTRKQPQRKKVKIPVHIVFVKIHALGSCYGNIFVLSRLAFQVKFRTQILMIRVACNCKDVKLGIRSLASSGILFRQARN